MVKFNYVRLHGVNLTGYHVWVHQGNNRIRCRRWGRVKGYKTMDTASRYYERYGAGPRGERVRVWGAAG